jgi:hypothetical protein
MVITVLFEQIFPSKQGLDKDEHIAHAEAFGNNIRVWWHCIGAYNPPKNPNLGRLASLSSPANLGRPLFLPLLHQQPPPSPPSPPLPPPPIFAGGLATRQKRQKWCKASKCLALVVLDYDMVTDCVFYLHCRHCNSKYWEEQTEEFKSLPYLVPPGAHVYHPRGVLAGHNALADVGYGWEDHGTTLQDNGF